MPRTIDQATSFKKDIRREGKAGHKNWPQILTDVLEVLVNDGIVDAKYRDHPLAGIWNGYRDCHIRPDLVLIYKKTDDPSPLLRLARLGSHSELFGE